jgi:DNA-binding response OmpR family regulator
MQVVHPDEVLRAGDLEIRPGHWLALASGRALMLTVREFQLLVALARRGEIVVSRKELFEVVWDRPLRAGDRTIDVYVRRLRVKLEAALPGWRFIHTHFGFGYRFAAEPLFTSVSQGGDHSVTTGEPRLATLPAHKPQGDT